MEPIGQGALVQARIAHSHGLHHAGCCTRMPCDVLVGTLMRAAVPAGTLAISKSGGGIPTLRLERCGRRAQARGQAAEGLDITRRGPQ